MFLLLVAAGLSLAASLIRPIAAEKTPSVLGRSNSNSIRHPSAFVKTALEVSGGGLRKGEESSELSDFSGAASALFGNIRVPAALFAGASAGAAFAMPLVTNEGLRPGMVKRVYALLMLTCLAFQMIALVVSTLSIGSINFAKDREKTVDVASFLQKYYELEWTATRFHFFSGLIAFVTAAGLRAWVHITCPVVGKAALGIIVSSTLMALAFLQNQTQSTTLRSIASMPVDLVKLYVQRGKEEPLFTAAVLSFAITGLYIVGKTPHVYKYLASMP